MAALVLSAGCTGGDAGLLLQLELPTASLPTLGKVVVELTTTIGSFVPQEERTVSDVTLQVETAVARIFIPVAKLENRASIDLLVAPSGPNPLVLTLGGRLVHLDGRAMGTGSPVSAVELAAIGAPRLRSPSSATPPRAAHRRLG